MYPDMVQSELNNFDQAICTYFSLDRTHPDVRAFLLCLSLLIQDHLHLFIILC